MASYRSKFLQPSKLDVDCNSPTAADEWKHWFRTFNNFLESLPAPVDGEAPINKLNYLIAHLTAPVYKIINDIDTYDDAIATLTKVYVKPKNEIFARHLLATAKQEAGESIDDFILRLNELAKECNFVAVTATEYRDEMKRDSFISGITSERVRERLLEFATLNYKDACDKAITLLRAKDNTASYTVPVHSAAQSLFVSQDDYKQHTEHDSQNNYSNAMQRNASQKCYFCDNRRHPRSKCPAREAECGNCHKVGHYARCCQSTKSKSSAAALHMKSPSFAMITAGSNAFSENVKSDVKINDIAAKALVDTGSTHSYIDFKFANRNNINFKSCEGSVSMANTTLCSQVEGTCNARLIIQNSIYANSFFYVMKNLVSDVIIGEDILKLHKSVIFNFHGEKPALNICSVLPKAITEYPKLFEYLKPDC